MRIKCTGLFVGIILCTHITMAQAAMSPDKCWFGSLQTYLSCIPENQNRDRDADSSSSSHIEHSRPTPVALVPYESLVAVPASPIDVPGKGYTENGLPITGPERAQILADIHSATATNASIEAHNAQVAAQNAAIEAHNAALSERAHNGQHRGHEGNAQNGSTGQQEPGGWSK